MSSYDVISIVMYQEAVVGSVIQATRFVGFEDGLRARHLNGLSMNEIEGQSGLSNFFIQDALVEKTCLGIFLQNVVGAIP